MRLGLGPGLAFLSGILFGASTPLAKLLLGQIDPWMLAGLLDLGSGVGLTIVRVVGRSVWRGAPGEAGLRGGQWGWLSLAVVAGGGIGPVLLMVGLARSAATAAALLLNLNLTRKISLSDPVQIALVKGCAAGLVNIGIALALGSRWPGTAPLAAAAVVGLAGYGVSLALFVAALRHIGAARTGAHFSLAPFFGAIIAVLVAREPVTPQLLVAGAPMGAGVWLHLTERHEHEHAHDAMTHAHRHVHEEHHRHAHDGCEPPGEPHVLPHTHAGLRHGHAHFPDIQHRHDH